jgi:hypothetical protein
METKVRKTIRWSLLTAIGLSISALIALSYVTGHYVGDLRCRTEAMDHGAGYFDILGDGLWHWGAYKAPPTWKARPPRVPASRSRFRVLAMAR